MKIFELGVAKSSVQSLVRQGFRVVTAKIGDRMELYDAVTSDGCETLIMNAARYPQLPGITSFLRKRGLEIPIIGIDSPDGFRRWPQIRAGFLDVGGDDLLQAPEDPEELVASVRAAHRRYRRLASDEKSFMYDGVDVVADFRKRSFMVDGTELKLSAKEMDVLLYLTERLGEACSRSDICEAVYDHGDAPDCNSIEVFITRIRKRLAGCRDMLQTVWGYGYRLESH